MGDVGSGREFRMTQSSNIPPFITDMSGNEHDTPFIATHVQSSNPDMNSQDSILLGNMCGLADDDGGPLNADLTNAVPDPEYSGTPNEQGMFHRT